LLIENFITNIYASIENLAPPLFASSIRAIAGGAILTMLADIMAEACELRGNPIAFSKILGFLISF
jgi:hypothetical protein